MESSPPLSFKRFVALIGRFYFRTYLQDENDACSGAGIARSTRNTYTQAACYEEAFFMPRELWRVKRHRVELSITQQLADAAHGGVLFYFCRIHSKMSGRIIINNADGSRAGTGLEVRAAMWPNSHHLCCAELAFTRIWLEDPPALNAFKPVFFFWS